MRIIITTVSIILMIVRTTAECPPTNAVCEFWFTVEGKRTMALGIDLRLSATKGILHHFYEDPSKNTSAKIPVDKVISMDGFSRRVAAINNRVPGPPIIVYKGQHVIVHVTNKLINEEVTIHWHGIAQKGTPYMDGVPYVTQCPITPGQSFTYKFKPEAAGTFFYHSHVEGQRVDGLFGAFVIKPKGSSNSIKEYIMHVGDWYHEQGSSLLAKMYYGGYLVKSPFAPYWAFAPSLYKSGHIEGRGRYRDPSTGNWSQTPLKDYHVESGKKYKFRVINPGMEFPFRISIDNHMLTIIASDGFDVEPRIFESFIIYPGERYDFLITANQPEADYWIRAGSMEMNYPDNRINAILRYNKTSTADPTSLPTNCLSKGACLVLNCLFDSLPQEPNSTCVAFADLDRRGGDDTPIFEDDSQEEFMNFVFNPSVMVINGRQFEHTTMSSLAQNDIVNNTIYNCNKPECGPTKKYCTCHHRISIPFNKTIQMVWTSSGEFNFFTHPIHLHGHSFHVVKMGYGSFKLTADKYVRLSDVSDIACSGMFCRHTSWKNPKQGGNNITGLKIKKAPQKDTVIVPLGGYVVIRFRSDNPGKWALHCHLEFHAMQGMMMVVEEAPLHFPEPPYGFPKCHSFMNDPKQDVEYAKVEKPVKVNGDWSKWGRFADCTVSCGKGTRKSYRECNSPKPVHGGNNCSGTDTVTEACNSADCPVVINVKEEKSWKFTGITDIVHILFFVFLGLFVIETVILVIYCCCCRKKEDNTKEGEMGRSNYAMS